MVHSTQWRIETADLDYQYEQYEMKHFVIDRSDSMEEDKVRSATEPRITIHRGHKIGVEPWVETYEKFLNQLFVILFGMFMMSCSTDMINDVDASETTSTHTYQKILEGSYEVDYKIHESVTDGSTTLWSAQDFSERDGHMHETKYTFTSDSLYIAQLMNDGWIEGAVKIKWKNGIPTQVGCREVVYANENEIHWMQNDLIIKSYLSKL